MKLLVVVCAFVAMCSGSAIPPIPGDNSHYVEGRSRYIWMPDGEGNPHLVDLKAPVNEEFLRSRNGSNNEYWLFTRQNRNNRQVVVNGNVNSVRNSNYRGNTPTNVIVHGWNSNGNTNWIPEMTDEFLDRADVNVFVLDWRAAAGGLYTSSVRDVPSVGQHLADFLSFVFSTEGGDWNNVHLVGHSLGAHVVGNAGRAAPSRPARVTGLDPAGPLWGGNPNALNRNSSVYVESIHTDGGLLGIMDPISHADFYPNGGRNPQPGCLLSTCSHGRAHSLFSSSIRTDHFNGRQCTNLDKARRNECTGATLRMGNSNLAKRGSGLFALSTGASFPF